LSKGQSFESNLQVKKLQTLKNKENRNIDNMATLQITETPTKLNCQHYIQSISFTVAWFRIRSHKV
jgi:hypothetical protein